MATIHYLLGRTCFALASCLPTLFLLVFLTDEVGRFLNAIASIPFLEEPFLLLFVVVASFILSFLLQQHHIRKLTYSLLAASYVPTQLAIVAVAIFLVVPFRTEILAMRNWQCYLLFGFTLSVITSDISSLIDYHRKCPTHLSPIESTLSKGKGEEERKPSFIRLEGFLWADFEKGLVVKRDETEEIMKKLRNERSVLVTGDQASGKSVILRSLGYKLALNRFIVFFVSADSLKVNLALRDIRNWNMANVIVLVDDVHKNPKACALFLEKAHTFNVKTIFSSRFLSENILGEEQAGRLARLFENRIEAKVSNDLVSSIVSNYCESLGLRFEPSEKDVASIIEKCGTDLWLITYLLASWDPRKTKIEELAKKDIYERIYCTRIAKLNLVDKDSVKTIQIVCALSQYEIPCDESYLYGAGLNNIAFKLSLSGDLIKKGRYYYLHHPSVARMYLETLEFYRLIEDVSSFSLRTLFSYLEKAERERPQVFYRLSISSGFVEQNRSVLENMLKSLKLEDLLEQVEQEKSIDKIRTFLLSISAINKSFAKVILKTIDKQRLARKLWKEPVVRIHRDFVATISRLDKNLARYISERKPLIISVTPLYNEEQSVPRIFENLFDYVDVAVVVDDGSLDNTAILAQEEGGSLVRHFQNRGWWCSMRTGLEKAISDKADVVVFDDYPWIRRDYISTLLKPILENSADLVLARSRRTSIFATNLKGARRLLSYLTNVLSDPEKGKPSLRDLYVGAQMYRMLRVEEIDVEYLSPRFLKLRRLGIGPLFLKKPSFIDVLFLLSDRSN